MTSPAAAVTTFATWIRDDPHWYTSLPTPALLNLQFIQANATELEYVTTLVFEQAAQLRALSEQVALLQTEVRAAQYTLLKVSLSESWQQTSRRSPRDSSPTTVVCVGSEGTLTDQQLTDFLTVWEQDYLCAAYLRRTQTCTELSCPRLHNRTPRDIVIQELRLVQTHRTITASTLFQSFYPPGTSNKPPHHDHREATVQTVAKMLAHVHRLCRL